MGSAGSQPQDRVADLDAAAVDGLGFFHGADGKPRQVILAIGIHARHFGRFAADQCASGQLAALGDAADHGRGRVHREPAAGEIIEEKQRLGALHENVVDAHRHEVDAHRVVLVPRKREPQLGADAVRAGDQHGLAVFLRHFKQRPEPAYAGQHPFAQGALGERLDAFDQGIPRIDVDARVTISQGRSAGLLCGHGMDRK